MNAWHQRVWWTVNENRFQLNDFVMDKSIKVVESGERLDFREVSAYTTFEHTGYHAYAWPNTTLFHILTFPSKFIAM